MKDLTGSIAVVTGASSGIGRAIALRLAAEGVALRLVGRNEDSLRQVAEAAATPRAAAARCYRADVASDEDLERLAASLARDAARIDVLVHCAGRLTLGRVADAPVGDLDLQYRTNVRAPYVLTQRLLPALKAGGGQVVFVNSSIWQNARSGISQYAATKYALKAFADSLRDEVNPEGVRVLSLFLGRTATAMQEAVHAAEKRAYRPEFMIQAEDVAETVLHALRLPPTAEVTDLHVRPFRKAPE